MESVDFDSTYELLNKYKANNGKRDDITVYSDDDSIFNSPSIEIGRSAMGGSRFASPLKSYGRERSASLSPSKKVRNDYQDHMFKARGGSHTGSPYKKSNYDLTEYNEFDGARGTEEVRYDSFDTDNTMDREIQKILDMSSLQMPQAEDEGPDKTELIIRETHKLVSTLPAAITGSKEGETYQKLLTSSINKLVKQFESVKRELAGKKRELMDKKRELASKDREVKNIKLHQASAETKLGQFQRDNSELLRIKLIKYRNLYTESQKENEELRARIDGHVQGMGTTDGAKVAGPHPHARPEQATNKLDQDDYKQKLVELQGQLADIISGVTVKPEPEEAVVPASESGQQPQPSMRMLAIFEDLVEAMKKEPGEALQALHQDPSTAPDADGDAVLGKVLASLDKNNEMYNKLLEILKPTPAATPSGARTPACQGQNFPNLYQNQNPSQNQNIPYLYQSLHQNLQQNLHNLLNNLQHAQPAQNGQHAQTSAADPKDIVFQCYVCCPLARHSPKRPCQRCSTASSLASDSTKETSDAAQHESAKDNKTINLMGEYKWTI